MSDDQDHCHYVVPRKKRRCKMLIKPGNFYCGEHSHLLPNSEEKQNEDEDRIPCPLDPKHSCSAKRMQKHLDKCPSKQKLMPDYIVPGVNLPADSENVDGLTISASSDELLLDIISRIDGVYHEKIAKAVSTEILTHHLIEEELAQEHIGPAAAKHLVQNSSLLGHLEKIEALKAKDAFVIEFGSGRGQMTFWIAKASPKEFNQKFLLVDKASHRHKYDNKLKDDTELNVQRIRADIQDLSLERLPGISNSSSPVIGVSKHLCGAATDLALRCIQHFSKANPGRTEAILIALCCHHRCDWDIYVGKQYLIGLGFKAEEFLLLNGITSWATCGTGKPRKSPPPKSEEEEKPKIIDRYERLRLPRDKREEIGRMAKRVIDFARCQFIEEEIGLRDVKMAYYADLSYTLENVVLVGRK